MRTDDADAERIVGTLMLRAARQIGGTVEDLQGQRRGAHLELARRLVVQTAVLEYNLSVVQVARYMGKDRLTVTRLLKEQGAYPQGDQLRPLFRPRYSHPDSPEYLGPDPVPEVSLRAPPLPSLREHRRRARMSIAAVLNAARAKRRWRVDKLS